jgi:HK97 family phage portal protein
MPPKGGTRTPLNVSFQQSFSPAWGVFGPGEPLVPPDPQPPRRIDFPVGVNTIQTPRAYESFGFPELRAFANVELVRLAIETRKDQLERLRWTVKPIEGRRLRADAEERARKVKKFLRKPDGTTHFSVWLRQSLEDLFVLDAPAFECRRNRNGELIALDLVPGDTVKLLVDQNGRTPIAPAPAYQQIIKGRVWANLTTQDLLYLPRNPRAGKIYGLSVVEQIIVTINTALQRQASQLAYFTAGNVPAGLATVPDGWTVDQLKAWQEWMDDALSGNLAERRKILWAPAGSKYQAFKEAPIKDDFDEWVARIVCFAFSLPPTPFIRQMNRGTATDDNERAMEEGLAPLMAWVKRLGDYIIQDEFGFADLEFAHESERDVDPEKQARCNDTYLKTGALTINEVRDSVGRDPIDGGDKPLIYTATGVQTLERALAEPEPAQIAAPGNEPASEPSDAAPATDPESAVKLAAVVAELLRTHPALAAKN